MPRLLTQRSKAAETKRVIADLEAERQAVATRIANVAAEIDQLSEMIVYAGQQGEISIQTELTLRLTAFSEQIVDLAGLYREIKRRIPTSISPAI